MFPYVEICNIIIYIFPFIAMLAISATTVYYILSSVYNKAYMFEVLEKVVPVLIGAAVGARFVSAVTLLQTSNMSFWQNLVYGGAVFYGGVLGGCVGLCVACRKKNQSFLAYADIFSFMLPLGQAIGRIGCFFNGYCYGCQYGEFCLLNIP